MVDVVTKAEKKYRNKISEYLSSDDYQVTSVKIETDEGVWLPVAEDAEYMKKFGDLEITPSIEPELVTITFTLLAKA